MHITIEDEPPLHERVVALDGQLAPAERTVARFLSDHPDLVASSNAAELAERIGTSNATVVRAVKALGYSGLPGLRRVLVQAMADRRDPARVLGRHIDRLGAEDQGGASIAERVLHGSVELMQQAHRLVEHDRWTAAIEILMAARSVWVYGVEQAGCVADYFAMELAWCGRSARAFSPTGIGIAGELINMAPGDALVVVAPIRHFKEIDVVVDHARSLRVPTILISETLGMTFEGLVDVVLPIPQSTNGLTGEVIAPIVLARAMALDVASRNREKAIKTNETINEVRAAVLGRPVDAEAAAPPSAPRRRGPSTSS